MIYTNNYYPLLVNKLFEVGAMDIYYSISLHKKDIYLQRKKKKYGRLYTVNSKYNFSII